MKRRQSTPHGKHWNNGQSGEDVHLQMVFRVCRVEWTDKGGIPWQEFSRSPNSLRHCDKRKPYGKRLTKALVEAFGIYCMRRRRRRGQTGIRTARWHLHTCADKPRFGNHWLSCSNSFKWSSPAKAQTRISSAKTKVSNSSVGQK